VQPLVNQQTHDAHFTKTNGSFGRVTILVYICITGLVSGPGNIVTVEWVNA